MHASINAQHLKQTANKLHTNESGQTVASPGFVARRGKAVNLVMGTYTTDFRAGCSSCSMTVSFVTNAVLIERAVSC